MAALAPEPVGTFLCRFSWSNFGTLVVTCKVAQGTPNSEDMGEYAIMNIQVGLGEGEGAGGARVVVLVLNTWHVSRIPCLSSIWRVGQFKRLGHAVRIGCAEGAPVGV